MVSFAEMMMAKVDRKNRYQMTATVTDDAGWEGLCRRCGLCCFEKIEDERGNIFYTQTPCRYLDVVSRHCSIYERRFAINPTCIKLTPELARTLRWLPSGCGYREPNEESAGVNNLCNSKKSGSRNRERIK